MKKLALLTGVFIFGLSVLTGCSPSKKCLESQRNYQDSINELSNKKMSLLNLSWAYKENADSCSYEFWMENAKELRGPILEYDQAIKDLQKKLGK